jgi:hypothetical protein
MTSPRACPTALIFLLAFTASSLCLAQFTVNLTVPSYGQDTSYYCGAASAQMMMQAYPNPADNSCQQQNHIYKRVQAHKTDTGFYTDPDGLRDTIQELNPPPSPGHYVVFNSTDRGAVMHDMLYWMAIRRYPSATLVNNGDHWVVITGYTTDVDPRTGSASLQFLDVNDPGPPDAAPHDNPCTTADEGNEGGSTRRVTGSSWYTNEWSKANKYGTLYKNDWVAVVEPPERSGWIEAPEQAISGTPIAPELARNLGLEQTWALGLPEEERFAFLRETEPNMALLANAASYGYYLIPFLDERGLCPGAVLVNAYTGEFQEIAAFTDRIQFISEEEALELAVAAVGGRPDFPPSAELVWESCMQTQSRYRPLWKVTIQVEDITFTRYVTQLGVVHTQIDPLPIGGI